MMTAHTAYSPTQMDANYPIGSEAYYWCVARNSIIEQAVRRHHDPSAGLMDVGCGRGFTVAHLQAKGFACYGSDLAHYDEPHPRARGKVFYGQSLQGLDLSMRNSISTVLLLDVIEHLPDPAVLLADVRDSFQNATTLMITVPARPEIWSNYDDYFGHYRRYSRQSLVAWADAEGLEILETGYFFHGLYLPARLMAALGLARATQVKVPRVPALHRLVAAGFVWENRLLPSNWPGTSVLGCFKLRRNAVCNSRK